MSSADEPIQILIVEDSVSLATVYSAQLSKAGYTVQTVTTGHAAMALLESDAPPLVLLDLHLPDKDGMEILRDIGDKGIPSAVVVVTSNASLNTAIEAMRLGAKDYLVKPFNGDRLKTTVGIVMRTAKLERLAEDLGEAYSADRFHGFYGASLSMRSIYRIIQSAAKSKATVFVTGESGTGKEVCAEAIHRASSRADGPFVAINCGAIPRDLIESEIFGHVKGAFTGAVTDREGAAKTAHGGTLFLDEICEMNIDLQAKLLRFLQTESVQKVGSSKPEPVDIRIVCATNQDPRQAVSEGRFREDLFYRLHVIPIHLPPLRDREDDALLLGKTFLSRYAREEDKIFTGFSTAAQAAVTRYRWPGNVRELQNVVRNAVVLNEGPLVEVGMLNLPERAPFATPNPEGSVEPDNGMNPASATELVDWEIVPLWQVEKEAIERAIAQHDGNVPRAAALLEISPSTIYRKRQAWEAAGLE